MNYKNLKPSFRLVFVLTFFVIIHVFLPAIIDLDNMYIFRFLGGLFLIFIVIYQFFKNTRLIKEQKKILKEYSNLNSKLEKTDRIKETMLSLSNSILSIDNTETLLHTVLEKSIEVIEIGQRASFMVLNDDNYLEFRAVVGYDINKLKNIKLHIKESFIWKSKGKVITEPRIIKNVERFDNNNLSSTAYSALKSIGVLDIESTLSTPIFIDGKLYGILNIDTFLEDSFNNEDLQLIKYFSNQISIIIKNHRHFEKTLYLSKYDSLTNTYNRNYLDEILKDVYQGSLLENQSFNLVVFDLDMLKSINDGFGHTVGDMVITHFANILKKYITDQDLFSRYGGDEFIGIFHNVDLDEMHGRVNEIIMKFNNIPLNVEGINIYISFSYGIANFPTDSDNIDELMKIADKRMYENKNSSKLYDVTQ